MVPVLAEHDGWLTDCGHVTGRGMLRAIQRAGSKSRSTLSVEALVKT